MKIERKSPIKAAPLRPPGQSIADRQSELLHDLLLGPLLLCASFGPLTALEWF